MRRKTIKPCVSDICVRREVSNNSGCEKYIDVRECLHYIPEEKQEAVK